MDALDARIARLEGAYEQLDRRLGALEGRMAALEAAVAEGFARLRTVIDTSDRWVIGIILVNWITLMLAIFYRR
ncbi:MAG: hypothetical protein QN129_12235 [Armatimonadota bacterium]|nr:hypothetical protein [Armatimonadota bacterium]MDR7529114.1 hypothetical protein [Armatimonadota bacterium]